MGRIEKLLLGILILAALTVRVWRIPDYLTFLGDEGRDITVVRGIITGDKYTLIGPGTSIGNMYLGPWYYYLMIPSVVLANFSPVGPAIMVALIGVATVILLWWISRAWFGSPISWYIAFLYALSPTVIIYSRSSWNPNIMPFFALLSMYSVWAIYRYGKSLYFPLLGFCLAMILNSHYLGLLLFPILGIYLYLAGRPHHTSGKFRLNSIAGFFVFMLMMSPLLIFDYRHNWQNLASLQRFLTVRQETVNLKPYKAIPNLWPLFTQINSSLILAKQNQFGHLLSLIILLSLLYSLSRYRKFRPQTLLISGTLLFGVFGLGLYKQHIYDHYFGFLYPVVFLSIAYVFRLLGPKSSLVFFALLLALNLSRSPLKSEPNYQLQRTAQIAEYINNQVGESTYNLALLSNHNYDASYRYFLNSNYRTLHQEITHQLFVICETAPCEPINHPLWEIAGFGWAKIDAVHEFPWGVKLFTLSHNPLGQI